MCKKEIYVPKIVAFSPGRISQHARSVRRAQPRAPGSQVHAHAARSAGAWVFASLLFDTVDRDEATLEDWRQRPALSPIMLPVLACATKGAFPGGGLQAACLHPPLARELFNCGHFSQLYANLARSSQLWYRAIHPQTAGCATPPPSMADSTRAQMNAQHGFSHEEVAPAVLQALRYQIWFDHPTHVAARETVL